MNPRNEERAELRRQQDQARPLGEDLDRIQPASRMTQEDLERIKHALGQAGKPALVGEFIKMLPERNSQQEKADQFLLGLAQMFGAYGWECRVMTTHYRPGAMEIVLMDKEDQEENLQVSFDISQMALESVRGVGDQAGFVQHILEMVLRKLKGRISEKNKQLLSEEFDTLDADEVSRLVREKYQEAREKQFGPLDMKSIRLGESQHQWVTINGFPAAKALEDWAGAEKERFMFLWCEDRQRAFSEEVMLSAPTRLEALVRNDFQDTTLMRETKEKLAGTVIADMIEYLDERLEEERKSRFGG